MIKADSKYKFTDFARPSNRPMFPWKTMKAGESFKIEVLNPHMYAANANKRYSPKCFKARKADDGYRMFRVK